MRKIITSLFLLFTISLSGQDLSGKWTGSITQTPNGNYGFELSITQIDGKVFGNSIVSNGNQIGQFKFRGFFDGDNLLVTETIQETTGKWCKKFYKLNFVKNQGVAELKGDWSSFNCNNLGSISLTKTNVVELEKRSNDNLSGIWTGTLYQDDKNFNFYYQIKIPNFESSNRGTSYAIAETNNGGHADWILTYDYLEDQNLLRIEELEIAYRFNNDWRWCVKEAELKLTELSDKFILEGKWWGNEKSEGPCAPGTIVLEKQKLTNVERVSYNEKRKINISKQIKTTNKHIEIEFWDHGKIDNDIISVYLNNEKVIDNTILTGDRKKISIKLNEGENYFIFHAENLGTIPPNTASFLITHDGNHEKVTLNGDLTHSDAILFIKQ